MGVWTSQDSLRSRYLKGIPRQAIRALAGFNKDGGEYFIARAHYPVPEELLQEVWPELDNWMKKIQAQETRAAEQAGRALRANSLLAAASTALPKDAKAFAKVLQYLRTVLFQDVAMLSAEYPDHWLLRKAPFNTPAFTAYATKVVNFSTRQEQLFAPRYMGEDSELSESDDDDMDTSTRATSRRVRQQASSSAAEASLHSMIKSGFRSMHNGLNSLNEQSAMQVNLTKEHAEVTDRSKTQLGRLMSMVLTNQNCIKKVHTAVISDRATDRIAKDFGELMANQLQVFTQWTQENNSTYPTEEQRYRAENAQSIAQVDLLVPKMIEMFHAHSNAHRRQEGEL